MGQSQLFAARDGDTARVHRGARCDYRHRIFRSSLIIPAIGSDACIHVDVSSVGMFSAAF